MTYADPHKRLPRLEIEVESVRHPALVRLFLPSRATLLKALLLFAGAPQISILSTPWYLADGIDAPTLPERPRSAWSRVRNLPAARE